MYLFFTERELKAQLISICINALVADIILAGVFHPDQVIAFMIMWFIGIVTFQLFLLYLPILIQKYCFKKLTPLEEQLMLKKKIRLIHDEIKLINNRNNRIRN
jgi:uncharacterized membrane protein